MSNDRDKNIFEKMLSKVTEPLWNNQPLSAEDEEELRKYAKNSAAYVEAARLKLQLNNDNLEVLRAIEKQRADRDERERNQEAP